MPEDLLRTKLTVPRMRAEVVARPRLLARLDEALPQEDVWQRSVTLISAPAGFGKTTLLCQWLSGCEHPTAWISLDEADNDPARFLAYLVAALQTIGPQISEAILDPLRSGTLAASGARSPLQTALIGLLNEMAAVPGPYVLVFDDYQSIENALLHEAVSFLLDNQPPQLHIAIATRVDPPLPIARLRAQGQLTEVHAADLYFTSDETTVFLSDIMQLSLAAEHVSALAQRTEGWIAGLQLAALALSGAGAGARRKSVAAFVEAFSGSHRFVLDYLTEEVLSQQSMELQDFLLRTSLLERLNASLCEALTGRADSQQVLEDLEAANLFIIPLDGERRWYRYHHLFADLLQQRLQQEKRELAPDLHRRASAWYEERGFFADAVQHALAAEQFERVASLIEKHGWAMLMRGEMNTLLRWIELLPPDLAGSRRLLCTFKSWGLAFKGQWEEVEEVLLAMDNTEAAGAAAAVRAYVAAVRGDVSRTRELAELALEELVETEDLQRALVTFCLAITYFSSGRPLGAARTLAEVTRLAEAAGQPHLVMTATAHLGHVYEMQGRLQRALEKHREALQLASGSGGRSVPFHGIAHVGIGEVLYEWNDLDGALLQANEGIRLTELGGFTSYMLAGYATLVRVYQAQGDWPRSEDTLRKAQRIMEARRFLYMEGVFTELRVRLWVAQGKLAALKQWLEKQHRPGKGPKGLAGEIGQLALARALIADATAETDPDAAVLDLAIDLMARLIDAAEEAGRKASVIRVLALQSVAYHLQGTRASALAVLERALSLAEPEGYVRTFLDEGAAMEQLLREALGSGIASSYCAALLAAFGDGPAAASSMTPGLVEPLSEREVEVLRLIAAGLSNREIAQELVIAISTVKSHINNMYGKLGVGSRTQAVARSRDLDLL